MYLRRKKENKEETDSEKEEMNGAFFFKIHFSVLSGFFPHGISGRFPRGKSADRKSRYPAYWQIIYNAGGITQGFHFKAWCRPQYRHTFFAYCQVFCLPNFYLYSLFNLFFFRTFFKRKEMCMLIFKTLLDSWLFGFVFDYHERAHRGLIFLIKLISLVSHSPAENQSRQWYMVSL